jgi:hypothetical protein
MIKVHFYYSQMAAQAFLDGHHLYNRVKRGWKLNKSTGKRVYGYWVGYESKPKKVELEVIRQ